ncbi:MAG: alpha-amylase, partial [Chloroflexota bacterium]
MREFHVSRDARDRYALSDALFGLHGGVLVADVAGARRLAARMNEARASGRVPGTPTITAGDIFALGVIHEVCHHVVALYDEQIRPRAIATAATELDEELGARRIERVIDTFAAEFPAGGAEARGHGAAAVARESAGARAEALEELLLLAVTNGNPAAEPLRELFDDSPLAATTDYPIVLARLEAILDAGPPVAPGGQPLVAMLRAPMLASPTSLAGQLRYIRERWSGLLGDVGGLLDRLLTGLDVITEEERALHLRFGGGGGPGPAEAPTLGGLDTEPERFSSDSAWMPRVVLLAKSTYVWLDQLSRAYGRDIRMLDAIPDEELDTLA